MSPADALLAATASEYAAARETAAVAELPGRELLAVTGPQRVKFLHNLVSNDLASLRPGQGVLAALMDVKGRLIATMRALVTEDAVRLEVPSGRLAVVEPLLVHYRVGAPVRFARLPAAVLGVMGPQAPDVLRRAGAELPPDMAREDHLEASVAGRAVRVVRASDLPSSGWVVHASPEDVAAVADALVGAGATRIGSAALDVLRIEDGRPWYGPDIGEDNLLHETGLLAEYHSPTKGCYVGQEVIARLEARGANVNKVLRRLRLESPATRGAAVEIEGKNVGRITTVGVSPRNGPIAIAMLHRSAAAAGTSVSVGGHGAVVEILSRAS